MKLVVDADRCQGHNRCVAIAPDLFEIDDFGHAHSVNGGVMLPDQVEAAERAQADCPESAIMLLSESGAT